MVNVENIQTILKANNEYCFMFTSNIFPLAPTHFDFETTNKLNLQ